MIGIGSIIGLRERQREQDAYCSASDRGTTVDFNALICAGVAASNSRTIQK
jgi:hypothetical protein